MMEKQPLGEPTTPVLQDVWSDGQTTLRLVPEVSNEELIVDEIGRAHV